MSYLELARQATKRAEARAEMDRPVLPLHDPKAEARRHRLLARLTEHPGLRYAIETEALPDGSHVIALAIPGATCELSVPPPRDPLAFVRDVIAAMDRAEVRDKSDKSDKRGG
ncbi:MAG: hypothetical protein MUC51_02320 [Anaerolineae bacterium]|jgi:hypothetical protein|nr:hypothetical protein [Anaerolineae bacterium]